MGTLRADPSGCTERSYERSGSDRVTLGIIPMVTAMLRKVVTVLTPGLIPNVRHPGGTFLTFLVNNVRFLRYIPYGWGQFSTLLTLLHRPEFGNTNRDENIDHPMSDI